MKDIVIKSVLGFNLNSDVEDENGKFIKKGIKYSIIPDTFSKKFKVRLLDKSFFTHFNEDLLNKIRQHRRLND